MNFFHGRLEGGPGGLWFKEDNFSVRLDDATASKLGSWSGKEVVFGIRPEDIADTLYVTNPDPDHTMKARIEVIEPMGAEVYLYCTTGTHTFVARMNTNEQAEVNQELTLVLTMKKAHVFDPATGATLT
jgi:multiple sugar transport system ATP-binding protein